MTPAFFLTTKDGACTLGITPYEGLAAYLTVGLTVGEGLSGPIPRHKDQWRREGFRRYGHWLLGPT